ncbi:unnamed protein product [Hapterophycus canaliculatus]
MDESPLSWGIMGAGRVCHDFVQALKSVPHAAKVYTVGCRELERSIQFADQHGIPRRAGSYADVAKDPGVDICYVGMLHPFHYENAVTALQNGKHVLVEKPSTCNESDTNALVRLAKEKGLFFMEGMWTRFFPAVVKAQEIVKSGAIGKVVAVHADFGFNGADVANYPDHIFYKLNLGGGGLFYVAPYPVAAAIQFLGPEPPSRIAAAGVKDTLTGVDLSGAISLHFEGKGIASLTYNIEAETPEETTVIGTQGRIKLLSPAHCPTAIEVTTKTKGRGNTTTTRHDFPLPDPPASVEATGGFNYPNSNGFQYEAVAIHQCIRGGHASSDQYSPDEIMAVMHVLEECRQQLKIGKVEM